MVARVTISIATMVAYTVLLALALFCVSAVHGDDYDDYSPRRTFDLRQLAQKLDRYFKLQRPHRNRFQPRYSEEESEEDIGLRGNFDDDDSSGSESPNDIMNDSILGTPVAPLRWQSMVAPFVPLIPNLADYCGCVEMANCGCCLGVYVAPLLMRNNVCLNVSLSSHKASGSKYMLRAKLNVDGIKIVDASVSEKQTPTACVSILPFASLAACAEMGIIYHDKEEDKNCACTKVSIEASGSNIIKTPDLCTCVGRPYSSDETGGPFGLPIKEAIHVFREFTS